MRLVCRSNRYLAFSSISVETPPTAPLHVAGGRDIGHAVGLISPSTPCTSVQPTASRPTGRPAPGPSASSFPRGNRLRRAATGRGPGCFRALRANRALRGPTRRSGENRSGRLCYRVSRRQSTGVGGSRLGFSPPLSTLITAWAFVVVAAADRVGRVRRASASTRSSYFSSPRRSWQLRGLARR